LIYIVWVSEKLTTNKTHDCIIGKSKRKKWLQVISGASDKLIEHKRSFEVYGLCVRERTTAADGRAHGDSQIQKCVSCDRWPPYHSSLSSSIL